MRTSNFNFTPLESVHKIDINYTARNLRKMLWQTFTLHATCSKCWDTHLHCTQLTQNVVTDTLHETCAELCDIHLHCTQLAQNVADIYTARNLRKMLWHLHFTQLAQNAVTDIYTLHATCAECSHTNAPNVPTWLFALWWTFSASN
jgi:hypothetical protein